MLKKTLIILTIFSNYYLFSTMQEPEIVLYQNNVFYTDVAPLETFSFYEHKRPFKSSSTANYRGYRGIWKVIDNTLYLQEIKITQTVNKTHEIVNIPLKYIFHDYVTNNQVKAAWYTGQFLIINEDTEKLIMLYIKNGDVIKKREISKIEILEYVNKDRLLNNHEPINITNYKLNYITIYNLYLNQFFFNDLCVNFDNDMESKMYLTKAQKEKTEELVGEIYRKYEKRRNKYNLNKKNDERKIAKSIYSKIYGYTLAKNNFDIVESYIHRYPHLYSLKITEPEFLKLELSDKRNNLIKIIWELNVNKGNTKYNWNDLTNKYNKTASEIINNYALNNLISSLKEPKVVLKIVENSPPLASSNEMNKHIWSKAKLKGYPFYEINIEDKEFYCTVLIGNEDEKIIVKQCGINLVPKKLFDDGNISINLDRKFYEQVKFDDQKYLEKTMKKDNKHWIEILSFNFTKINGKYLIIEKSGIFNLSKSWDSKSDENMLLLD